MHSIDIYVIINISIKVIFRTWQNWPIKVTITETNDLQLTIYENESGLWFKHDLNSRVVLLLRQP